MANSDVAAIKKSHLKKGIPIKSAEKWKIIKKFALMVSEFNDRNK